MRSGRNEMALAVAPGLNAKKKRKRQKKKKKKVCGYIRVDLSCCRYQILRIALRKLGWEATTDDTKPWHLFWTDASIGADRLMMLKRGQKINHFVGMLEICRKKALARNLSMMRKIFPAAYKFFPRAFILPNQLTQFLARFNTPKPRTYILKPDTGSMGRGVVLVQTPDEVKNAMKGLHGANFVAQKYLTKPMLLNGYKFDLRIYVLILSCNPLRLYLYKEGLARFCTEKYMKPDQKNIKVSRMHLTNYSLNKYSSNFEFNSSTTEVNKGSKWTLTALLQALAAEGFDTNQLYAQIKRMVVLTVVAIVPVLAHSYKTCLNEDDNGRSCFELLGLDVLVDEKCKPWLLEVNHSPSFSIDTPLDYMVKEALILDTLKLINIDPTGISKVKMEERRDSQLRLYGKLVDGCEEEEEENPAEEESSAEEETCKDVDPVENRGNFDMIYPTEDANLQKFYDRCLAGASELFTHSFDMKVKKEIAKVQEEKRQEEVERQEAEKKRAEMELRKKAREAAKNVAILRKEVLSQRAAAAAASAAASAAARRSVQEGVAAAATTTMTSTTTTRTTATTTTTVKRSSSRLGKKSPSPTASLGTSTVSMALSLVGSPITSPGTSTPKSRPMEVEEDIVHVEGQEQGGGDESVQLFDEVPEGVSERRPESMSARSSAVEEATSTLNDILYPQRGDRQQQQQQQCPKAPIHSSELETSLAQEHEHVLGFGGKTIPDFLTAKKLKGTSIGHQHHHRNNHDHQDNCFTARGYVKSVSGLPSETKCAHCQRHKGRALALKNTNVLPMTLHEMTTLASSFLTHRWEHDKSSAKSIPLKKSMGVSESMKAQFRSKLLNFQRTGGFLAHPSLLRPLQRMPWDASTNSNRHRQRLNIMLDTTTPS